MSLFCFTAASGSIPLSLVKGCTFGTFCVQDKKGGDFMLNFTAMIQGIDTIFTNFIFIPALLILYLKFRPRKPWSRRTRNLYRLCIALISVYVIRIFCAGFIFTPVNYPRFADSGFYAHPMGIHHLLSYNIRIKHVSEVNLYETETNPLPILRQHRNFKGCVLCIWK